MGAYKYKSDLSTSCGSCNKSDCSVLNEIKLSCGLLGNRPDKKLTNVNPAGN